MKKTPKNIREKNDKLLFWDKFPENNYFISNPINQTENKVIYILQDQSQKIFN